MLLYRSICYVPFSRVFKNYTWENHRLSIILVFFQMNCENISFLLLLLLFSLKSDKYLSTSFENVLEFVNILYENVFLFSFSLKSGGTLFL